MHFKGAFKLLFFFSNEISTTNRGVHFSSVRLKRGFSLDKRRLTTRYKTVVRTSYRKIAIISGIEKKNNNNKKTRIERYART